MKSCDFAVCLSGGARRVAKSCFHRENLQTSTIEGTEKHKDQLLSSVLSSVSSVMIFLEDLLATTLQLACLGGIRRTLPFPSTIPRLGLTLLAALVNIEVVGL